MDEATALIDALGGPGNIVDVEGCILRIRVEVRDQALVDEPALRRPGVIAVVRSGNVVQVVAGTASDGIAAEIVRRLRVSDVTPEPPNGSFGAP